MGVKSVQAQQDCIISLFTDLPDLPTLALPLPQVMPLQKHGNRAAAQSWALGLLRQTPSPA